MRIRQARNGKDDDVRTVPADAPSRWPRLARRAAAVAVAVMVPTYVSVLVASGGPVTELSRADSTYLAAQLVQADRRVRKALADLRPLQTSAARARTREAIATTRSLALEIRHHGGDEVQPLRRALRLEADWLDAVGSTLANPRSLLREALASRDAALRPALGALPGPAPTHREGTQELLDYARWRSAAVR